MAYYAERQILTRRNFSEPGTKTGPLRTIFTEPGFGPPEKRISYPLSDLIPIIEQGKELFSGREILASKDGHYQRFFGRDTYMSILLLLTAGNLEENSSFPFGKLKAQALHGLSHIREGELAHESGTKDQGFIFPVDPKTGIGEIFGSVDVNGWAMKVLLKMYDKKIADSNLYKQSKGPLESMIGWAVKNSQDHKGMIGHTFLRVEGPIPNSLDGNWQDGALAVLNDKGEIPKHPIAYVLEQGLYWNSLMEAAGFFEQINPELSKKARFSADKIKEAFNRNFLYSDNLWGLGIARAVDAKGDKIHFTNIDELISLGFIFKNESIINGKNEPLIMPLVRKIISELSTPWGLRTQDKNSVFVPGCEYHGPNSIWPVANALAVNALESLRELPVIKHNPKHSNELHELALRTAIQTTRGILKAGTAAETLCINDDGSITPYYRETRPDGTSFQSSSVHVLTVSAAEYIYRFLQKNGVTEIPMYEQ